MMVCFGDITSTLLNTDWTLVLFDLSLYILVLENCLLAAPVLTELNNNCPVK